MFLHMGLKLLVISMVGFWDIPFTLEMNMIAGHLIKLGYGPSFSADIIREAKKLMIAKGHTYYQSKKLDRVPKEAVEELLGITLPDTEN